MGENRREESGRAGRGKAADARAQTWEGMQLRRVQDPKAHPALDVPLPPIMTEMDPGTQLFRLLFC